MYFLQKQIKEYGTLHIQNGIILQRKILFFVKLLRVLFRDLTLILDTIKTTEKNETKLEMINVEIL